MSHRAAALITWLRMIACYNSEMGATDIAVLRILAVFSLPLLFLVAFMIIVGPKFNRYSARYISSFLLRLEEVYDEVSAPSLKSLLSPLQAMQSHNWCLRNVGLLRVLVLNPKTGEIFKHLPKNCHVVVHDRNTYSRQFLKTELGTERRKNVHIESVFIGHPEDMSQVQTGSIDAVVATRVLCSSHNVSRALDEIHRVLAPGGKFFFMEHTQDSHPYSQVGKIQAILTKSRLWPLLTHNCHLNRTPEEAIAHTPHFHQLHLDYLRLPVMNSHSQVDKWISWLFRLKPLHVLGNCTKPSSGLESDCQTELDECNVKSESML